MAGKKQSTAKGSASKAKSGAKSSAAKNTRSSGSKSNTKSRASSAKGKSTSSKQSAPSVEQLRQRNQTEAILWFGAAILTACFVLIPGGSVWLMVHNVLRGVFGGWAILLAVLMGYIAVSKTMEQTTMLRGGRLALMVVIVVLFCTAGHVFGSFFPKEKSFFKLVGILYMHGVEQGGAGLVGGLVGELLVKCAEAAADAQKATEEFMKKKLEAERMETQPAQSAPKEEDSSYIFPPVTMLASGKKVDAAVETEELQTNGKLLVETLKSFGVQTKILDICRGPAVTRYELQPAAGVKISKITNLADDLAMNLAATGVRIEAPIPGKAAVGIEVPNKVKTIVRMRELVESNSFVTSKSHLTVALGRDIAGQVTVADLSKMPHILIAGTTGSGKSVCINSLIVSLLYKSGPDDVRFLMIDPKVVELGIYNGIPHLLVPVVTDPRKAAGALNWAVTEMLKRYKIFAENNVRDLKGYNALAQANNYQDENGQPMHKMPQIVIIIDELSDLMMAAPNEVEDAICRLAQMARAAGMHLVVATQRPSVDVVTGLIKANIPSRIAFAVSSAIDSRTILDSGGAEKLLGQGDMLFSPVGAQKPLRIQGCFVSDSEIESVVDFVKNSRSVIYDDSIAQEIERSAVEGSKSSDNGSNDDEGSGDPMMNEAIKCVVEAGQASTSLLQRRLRLGYARAGRLIDEMEQMGIVGPHEGSKPRQVLITYAQWLEMNMQKQDTPGDA